jgi:hypothetical protein
MANTDGSEEAKVQVPAAPPSQPPVSSQPLQMTGEVDLKRVQLVTEGVDRTKQTEKT